jgi:hypothetical protein
MTNNQIDSMSVTKPCVKCKWYASAIAGPYCVNPTIKGNKTTLAIYGSLEGKGMQLGEYGNQCKYVRNGECGMDGKLWEGK